MGIAVFTFLFVIALSLDSFGIGCIIGMKNIGVTWKGIIGIGMVSGSCFLLSSYAGRLLLPFLTEQAANRIGAVLLIAIGCFYLWQHFRKEKPSPGKKKPWTQPARVFQNPVEADMDQSGGIRGKEVLVLGAALSLDSFGAGISGALIGISPLLTAGLIAAATCIMLAGGLICGAKLNEKIDSLSLFPAILLIIIAIIKLT
ncbi:manganese efflux pump [Halobacillus salinarum]|uniref:Manganese efflux pump n=1 Tax=Halobacillus salinarum TaxID=2932257 RepID=A0ABY4ENZ2_9BACI|nr:manganese efflux pump [Halobacillus salinarum]UOQ46178.1 manganese efflux pump [Halobacillus salinarum]